MSSMSESPEAVAPEPAEVAEEVDEAPLATPSEADPVLLAAREMARAALAENTPAESIGADAGHEVHDSHVLTLFFECRLPGYPGWRWAATLARIDENAQVNLLETELLPGAEAVIAPDWVPWSERLAQYRETQAKQAVDEAAAAEAAASELGDEDDDDDLMENDYSDFDSDIDGVDVDDIEIDESVLDSDDDADDFDDDSDDDDSDDDTDDDDDESDDEDDDFDEDDADDDAADEEDAADDEGDE